VAPELPRHWERRWSEELNLDGRIARGQNRSNVPTQERRDGILHYFEIFLIASHTLVCVALQYDENGSAVADTETGNKRISCHESTETLANTVRIN
jgi:hypothetical protein